MNFLRILLIFAALTQSPWAWSESWLPSAMNGQIYLMEEDGTPVGERAVRNFAIEPIRNSDGSFIRQEKDGRRFLKVNWLTPQGSKVPYWVEEDFNDFEYTHQQCLTATTGSNLERGAQVRDFANTNRLMVDPNSTSGLPVRVGTLQCSQSWTQGCVRDYKNNWRPAWIQSSRLVACQQQQTEAGVQGRECTDCETPELQGATDSLSEIARRTHQLADAQLTKFVPQNLHDYAIQETSRCYTFADYLVRKMDADTFIGYVNLPGGLNPRKTQEDVNRCEAVLRKPAGQRSPISSCYGIAQACNRPDLFKGWCLKGMRRILQASGMLPGPDVGILGGSAKNAGGALRRCGFENMIETFRQDAPPYFANIPPGAVLIYHDPTNSQADGHAEVFTGSQYCSDFCSSRPISAYRQTTRIPTGIYIKTRNVSAQECVP